MKFAVWTHPRTGETRVYINGVSNAEKAFIVASDAGYEVKCFGMYRSQLDQLMDEVEAELTEMNGGDRPDTFEDVLRIVNNK